jgi:hypothetical protein
VKRFAIAFFIMALMWTLSSCESMLLGLYRHQGRDPKAKKYVPVVRDFGGFNGREIWLYSPEQLE